MTVRAVKAAAAKAPAKRRTPGRVERAAKATLSEIDTDHAAAELLTAIVERLAQDIDEGEPRDRHAATKTLLEVLRELDTAVIPPAGAGVPSGGGDDDRSDDDPFEIGTVPPQLGDAAAS